MAKKRRRESSVDPSWVDCGGSAPGAGGDNVDGSTVDGIIALLNDAIDNAGPEHDKSYLDDLREALDLLSKWATPDGGGDDDPGIDESRRRAYRPGHALESFGRKAGESDEEYRRRRVGILRRGRF